MNTYVQAALDHIKAKADLNSDGKVDKVDLELIGKMMQADAQVAVVKATGLTDKLSAHYGTLVTFCVGGVAGAAVTAFLAFRIG